MFSLENITKGWIGDSPQTAPALAHLTYKEEATSPPEPVNSEVSPTHTALVDAQSRNGVLDGASFLRALLACAPV
ncbi:uncharacterized protein P174DRAFT_196340, partial [Aspergillus novofumigatus IBT 16806]